MNILQRKASMVLYALEKDIGELAVKANIADIHPSLIQDIYDREKSKGRAFDPSEIKDIVEATYLDELFRIAMTVLKDRTEINFIKYLYSIFHTFEIYQVRNAVSHPNRNFLDFHWYRLAALVTDPVIDILNLIEVKKAFVSAQEEILTDPPEEWLSKIIWEIPNNLPKNFEHALTGLLGRQKELQQLEGFIINPRIPTIALVAPGGLGKTALALDLLQTIVHSPTLIQHIDGVIFLSLKTEKLTATGIKTLTAVQTIAELKIKLANCITEIFNDEFSTYEDCIEKYKDKNLLLCIDNLETILRDEQDIFEDFNSFLPLSWRVLITSRVVVENAKTLSLPPLDLRNGSLLARKYQQSKGMVQLNNDIYDEIAEKCHFNPLAIRLTIDLVNLGRDIPTSISKVQKNISEFSYNHLMEALSATSIEILEAIFVENQSTRGSLCHLLEKDLDQISDGVGELSRTSLIVKNSNEDVETYSLNNSIKELLLISPRNMVTRGAVQSKIFEQKNKIREIDFQQANSQTPNWHTNYIPPDTPESLKIVIKEAHQILKRNKANVGKNHQLYSDLLHKIKEQLYIHKDNIELNKTMARVLGALKDTSGQQEYLLKALAGDQENPSTLYLLARYYSDQGDYENSALTYEKLIDYGWIKTDEENIAFSKSIYNGYFLSLLYSKQSNKVLSITKKWKEMDELSSLFGVYRATAWKREIETYQKDDINSIEDALNSSTKIFDHIFRHYGYSKEACKQSTKLIEEIIYYSKNSSLHDYSKLIDFLNFSYRHIISISENYVSFSSYSFPDLIDKLKQINFEKNPFKSIISIQLTDHSARNLYIQGEKIHGFMYVLVTYKKNHTLFAEDKNKNKYFLHKNQYNGSKNWLSVKKNDLLKVLAEDLITEGRLALKIKEAYSVNQ